MMTPEDRSTAFVQLFDWFKCSAKRRVPVLEKKAVVGYTVHVVLLNFDPSFVEYYIRKGFTCVGFRPLAMEATKDPTQDDEE